MELLREGLQWEVHNGVRTLFWKDVWLGNEALQQCRRGAVGEDALQAWVVEYWSHGEGVEMGHVTTQPCGDRFGEACINIPKPEFGG